MSGGLPTWMTQATIIFPVTSVFGRTGDILSMTGDYISDQVTEGLTNLYFTSSRAQDALSGTVSTLSGRIATNEFSIIGLS